MSADTQADKDVMRKAEMLPLPKSLQPGGLLYAPSREALLQDMDFTDALVPDATLVVPGAPTRTPTKAQVQDTLTAHFGKRQQCYKKESKWFFLRRTADKHCSKQAWAEVIAYDTAMGLVLSPAYAAAFAGCVLGGTLAFSGAVVATAVPASMFAVPAMMYEPFRRATPLRKYPNRLNQAAWSGANLVVHMTKSAVKEPAETHRIQTSGNTVFTRQTQPLISHGTPVEK